MADPRSSPSTIHYSFPRYLAVKKPIDDRSLNAHVWNTLANSLYPGFGKSLRVLEIGCGIGTMYERLLARGVGEIQYTGVDSDPDNIIHARQRFSPPSSLATHPTFVQADLFALPASLFKHSFDLLIAHAVLDLLEVPRALPSLFSYLRPGGIFYFTLNFDGGTIFQPEHPLDERIIPLYHATMDERVTEGKPSGDSRTGRHLFAHLKTSGEILAAGSSDWVIFPGKSGYLGDEAYFLHHILHFFEQSLTGHRELDESAFADWLATRHYQVEQAELVYVAHQLDFVGTVRG